MNTEIAKHATPQFHPGEIVSNKPSCQGSSTEIKVAACCPGQEKQKGRPQLDWLLWGSLSLIVPLLSLALVSPSWLTRIHWLHTMATATFEMVAVLWWGVLVGAVFVGILSKIPRDFIMAILGQGGSLNGLLRATGAGLLLDLCSHGILIIGAKLYERGASAGQVVAFLLASPWNSFSLTLILITLIGLSWTLTFIAASFVVALATGYLFDRLVQHGVLPQNPNSIPLNASFNFWVEAKTRFQQIQWNRRFYQDMLMSGIRDSQMVVRWLLLGVLFAAGLRALLDASQFESYFGATVMGLFATIFAATLLEVCSEGSAPIAADLVTRANAPGNGFAFLMAGVATDYTEIMVLKQTTQSWRFALCLPLLTVPQVVLISVLINSFA